ncbi:hypothetical protein BS47DRAFT_1306671, partial [Hydnum rufescens UP504]
IISIMAHSTNVRCNGLQAAIGFFLKSTNTPKTVCEVLAHGSLSVVATTVSNMLCSLREEQEATLKQLGSSYITSIAYDNLDFKFKPGQTTLANQRMFESITTGLFCQLSHGVEPSHLQYAHQLWDSSPLNDH